MKILIHPTLSGILSALVLAACGGTDDPTAGCHSLAQEGPVHDVALASSPPSDMTGGSISDGKYVLSAARLFDVPVSVDIKRKIGASLEVKGDVIVRVSQIDGKVVRSSLKYEISGSTLKTVDSCAGSKTAEYKFTATSTTLEIQSPDPGTSYTLHEVFDKR